MPINNTGYKALTYSDVMIEPKFTIVRSRKNTNITTDLGNGLVLDLPIISANMETITEVEMALVVAESGGLGLLHRFMPVEHNINMWNKIKHYKSNCGVSIGVTEGEKERAEALIDNGANVVCIDVANGASIGVVEQLKWLRSKYKDNLFIIAGNFATARSLRDFMDKCGPNNHANIYKIGIGGGSICSTKNQTGVHVPMISSIIDCSKVAPVIADGGIRETGDICKALAAGAKAVMIGGMIAGTLETPGEINIVSGKNWKGEEVSQDVKWKVYRGSAFRKDTDGYRSSEGVEIKIPFKGSVVPILNSIKQGLASSFTYVNARTLNEFQRNAEFIIVG